MLNQLTISEHLVNLKHPQVFRQKLFCVTSRINCHNELMQWAVDYLCEWLSLLKLLPATIMWLSWWEFPSCHWVCWYFRRHLYTSLNHWFWREHSKESWRSAIYLEFVLLLPFLEQKINVLCWSSIRIKVLPLQTADPFWWCRMMLAYCMPAIHAHHQTFSETWE
jgi:hypothetical protein